MCDSNARTEKSFNATSESIEENALISRAPPIMSEVVISSI